MVFDARFDIESLRVMNDSTMAAFHGMTKLAASHVARTTPHMYAYAHLVDRGSAMIACRRNCATNRLGRVRNPKSDSLATPTEGPQKQRQGKSESDSPSPSRSRRCNSTPNHPRRFFAFERPLSPSGRAGPYLRTTAHLFKNILFLIQPRVRCSN